MPRTCSFSATGWQKPLASVWAWSVTRACRSISRRRDLLERWRRRSCPDRLPQRIRALSPQLLILDEMGISPRQTRLPVLFQWCPRKKVDLLTSNKSMPTGATSSPIGAGFGAARPPLHRHPNIPAGSYRLKDKLRSTPVPEPVLQQKEA